MTDDDHDQSLARPSGRASEPDHDTLGGIDLAAWETPPSSAAIADAVVARMREPVGAAALDAPRTAGSRRWWLAGAVAAVAAAGAVAFTVWGLDDRPTGGSGAVATAKPSHVELGESAADLEANTDVRWMRDGHRLTASQPRGIATWRVAGDDNLVIDAGAMGASVEATGASLRVEVQMNLSDARTIGVTALTAAAVAMVTVIVYEGHVKVSSGGQTVNVSPGGTVEVRPGEAPKEPIAVGLDPLDRERTELLAELEGLRAANLDHAKLREEILLRELEIKTLQQKLDGLGEGVRPAGPALEASVIDRAMKALGSKLAACRRGFDGKLELSVKVAASGAVTDVAITPADAPPVACVAGIVRSAKFPASPGGATFKYPLAFSAPCDFDALAARGDQSLAIGAHAAALASFEAALACKPDAKVVSKAYVAACNARNASKARAYFGKLAADRQALLSQICLRNNIDPRVLATVAQTDLGRASISSGMAKVKDRVLACNAGGTFGGQLKASVKVAPDGTVSDVTITPGDASIGPCVAGVLRTATFEETRSGGSFRYPFVFTAFTPVVTDPAPVECDPATVAADEATADASAAQGRFAASLVEYEAVLRCKPAVLTKVYMAACKVRRFDRAKLYFKRLPTSRQEMFAQICIREGFDPRK